MRYSGVRNGRLTTLLSALATAACMIALTACGSSSDTTVTSPSSGESNQLAFAECMRSHGVPNYPDSGNLSDTLAQSPAFQAAAEACRSKFQPGGGPHGGLPESTRLSLLHHAECMRAHGVPNYPDPHLPSRGPYEFGPPRGIDTSAPAFQHAASACGGG